jgi:hypothetical protein
MTIGLHMVSNMFLFVDNDIYPGTWLGHLFIMVCQTLGITYPSECTCHDRHLLLKFCEGRLKRFVSISQIQGNCGIEDLPLGTAGWNLLRCQLIFHEEYEITPILTNLKVS